jgi:hypothetical protein
MQATQRVDDVPDGRGPAELDADAGPPRKRMTEAVSDE